MNFEKIEKSSIISLKFEDKKELMDIDYIFELANNRYTNIMNGLLLVPTFMFATKNDRKIYTHSFYHSFFEYLKNRDREYTLYFFSNSVTKDKFRNQLIKKLKQIFGIRVLEMDDNLYNVADHLEVKCVNMTTKVELFFNSKFPVKRYKTIRNSLEKEGLLFLYNQYFDEYENKLLLYC